MLFKIADLITIGYKNYYQINRRILEVGYDLFFEKSCDITNVLDIISYEDLIYRLETVIAMLKK